MQCPSCGFENMPGRQDCAVCSTSLAASGPQSVMPPRARNRSIRQRTAWRIGRIRWLARLGTWMSTLRSDALLSTHAAAARASAARGRMMLVWPGWSTMLLILLSAIPGYAHSAVLGKRRQGFILFASSVASVIIATALWKTVAFNWIMWSLAGVCMWTMFLTADHLRAKVPGDNGQMRLGVGLMITALFFGGYALLRLAASPIVAFVGVNLPVPAARVASGDTLLLLRNGSVHRGDVSTGEISWEGYRMQILGPVLGMPGDRLVISDRLYVNGRAVEAQLPPLYRMGEQRLYSIAESAQIQLGADEYWMVPSLDGAPDAQRVLETGVVECDDITGRVIAITDPPAHRRFLARTSR